VKLQGYHHGEIANIMLILCLGVTHPEQTQN